QNCIGTRRLLALMVARLERGDQRGAAGARTRAGQRNRLRVRAAEFGVEALSDDLPARQDHGADEGVGMDAAPASPGEVERASHPVPLVHRASARGYWANRTAREPRRTSPMIQVATPSAAAAACAAATASGGSTATRPTPRLKTSRISSTLTPPACCRTRKRGGQVHELGSTVASTPAGSIRTRLPPMPPPVMCARPCT